MEPRSAFHLKGTAPVAVAPGLAFLVKAFDRGVALVGAARVGADTRRSGDVCVGGRSAKRGVAFATPSRFVEVGQREARDRGARAKGGGGAGAEAGGCGVDVVRGITNRL